MKFKFALGSLLILMSMSSIVNAQIDANKAISELSILQESLNQSDINERMLKETREKAINIRTEALSCVNRIEPQVETLKLELARVNGQLVDAQGRTKTKERQLSDAKDHIFRLQPARKDITDSEAVESYRVLCGNVQRWVDNRMKGVLDGKLMIINIPL